jgi:hypothetical protein
LLDAKMEASVVEEIREVVAESAVRATICDLHVLRVAKGGYALGVSLVTDEVVQLDDAKSLRLIHDELAHIHVEVNGMTDESATTPAKTPGGTGALRSCQCSLFVLLVGHRLHPLNLLSVDHFGQCQMGNGRGEGRAVPVALPARTPDHVSSPNSGPGPAFALRPADAAQDDQGLTGVALGVCAVDALATAHGVDGRLQRLARRALTAREIADVGLAVGQRQREQLAGDEMVCWRTDHRFTPPYLVDSFFRFQDPP